MIEGNPRVRILDAMAEGLVIFATRFVSVLRIYALPWLVAVAVVVVIDLFWIYSQRRISPDWFNGLCWSVALAPATLALVRFGVADAKRHPIVWPRWDQLVFAAAVILAIWSVMDNLSDWAGMALRSAYFSWHLDYALRHKLDYRPTLQTIAIVTAIGCVAPLLKVFWQLLAVGALVALVKWNRIAFKRLLGILKTQPLRWLFMSLAVIVFGLALDWAFRYLHYWTGIDRIWPGSFVTWRTAVLPIVASYFANFPWTLVSTIPMLMMARAFAPFVAERDASKA